MKYILYLAVSALVVALVKCEFENDIDDFQEGDLEDQLEGLEEEEINEKRGYWKLTRFALERLASVLRRNRNLIKRYLKDYWGSASSREIDDAIDVILTVADKLNRFDKASSQYFIDVAASLGLSRGFGLAVYNAVKMLL